MRKVDGIPSNWEVHAFPGAKYGHVAGMIPGMIGEMSRNLRWVVVQVGVNHRDDQVFPGRDVTAILSAVAQTPAGILFVGVSYSATLPQLIKANIDKFNGRLQELCGEHYMPPLPIKVVRVDATDQLQIHFTTGTAGKVLDRVLSWITDHDC